MFKNKDNFVLFEFHDFNEFFVKSMPLLNLLFLNFMYILATEINIEHNSNFLKKGLSLIPAYQFFGRIERKE